MAITFNGTTDEIQVPGAGAWPAWNGLTIACICYRGGTGVVQNIYIADASGSGSDIRLSISATEKGRLFLNGTNAVATNAFNGGVHLFWGATKPTGTSNVTIRSAQLDASHTQINDSTGTSLADPGTAAPGVAETLGSQNGISFWNGDVTALAIWNRELTAEQFYSLMAIGYKNWWTVPGCVRHFVLDQASTGTKIVDLAGSGAKESTRTGTTVSTRSVPLTAWGSKWREDSIRRATGAVNANAGTASATGSASGPSTSIAASIGSASGSGTAGDATVVTGAAASAGAASGTGTGGNAAGAIQGSSGAASASGTVGGPAGSLKPSAGSTSATGSAFDATVSTATQISVPAGLASGTGTASTPSASIAPHVGQSVAVGSGFAATVPGPAAVNAQAGAAQAVGVGRNALVTTTSAMDLHHQSFLVYLTLNPNVDVHI